LSTVLLEKLTVTQLVKKFPAFYGPLRFITVFTRTCHWPLSWVNQMNLVHTLTPSLWGSIAGRSRDILLFTVTSRLALGPTQPPISGVPGHLTRE